MGRCRPVAVPHVTSLELGVYRLPPCASSPQIRLRMQNTRRRDTGPEIALRSLLHRAGLRFFVDRSPLHGCRRRADIVFPRIKLAVFVDGCFWHSCPQHGTLPRANHHWWVEKLKSNQQLSTAGWTVLRFWEHEEPQCAARVVMRAIRSIHRVSRRLTRLGKDQGPPFRSERTGG